MKCPKCGSEMTIDTEGEPLCYRCVPVADGVDWFQVAVSMARAQKKPGIEVREV